MLWLLSRTSRRPDGLRQRITGIYASLILANLAAWAWAVLVFRDQPVLLGTALLAYGFGLRHAVDADHIAAIDNVTRKLMQEGKRPVGVGLFFALGHSSVVILAAAGVAVPRRPHWRGPSKGSRLSASSSAPASLRCSCSLSPPPT